MYLGLSLELLSQAFEIPVVPYTFIIKLLLISITLSTGFQGGEVTILFVIGATLGKFLAPLFGLPISFLAGLGMIGVFCGGNIKYIFVVCVISYVFSGKSGIYTSQKIQQCSI